MRTRRVVAGWMAAASLLAVAPVAGAAPGDLDPTFSEDGLAVTATRGDTWDARDAVLQPDGKIIVSGEGCVGSPCTSATVLARFNPDGSLDSSFSSDGVATLETGAGSKNGQGVALQPDGKIVVSGTSYRSVMVTRFTADGALDESFGDGGAVLTGVGSYAYLADIELLPGGDIIVGGYSSGVESNTCYDPTFVRYTESGSIDPVFSDDGVQKFDFGTCEQVQELAVQSNGRVIATGDNNRGVFFTLGIARDGRLDPTFGEDGIVTTSFARQSAAAFAVTVAADDEIVVAGAVDEMPIHTESPQDGYAVARYLPDGTPDGSFGGDGSITGRFVSDRRFSIALEVAMAPDGDIAVLGASSRSLRSEVSVARLNPDGSLDGGFGGSGSVAANFGSSMTTKVGLVDADGRIVAVSGISTPGPAGPIGEFALLRFRVDDGPPDADADGLTNESDRCPKRFGREHRGCPRHTRSLELELLENWVDGHLNSPELECEHERRVLIFRKIRGRDRLIGSATTESYGRYYLHRPLKRDTYYSVAPRFVRPGIGICERVRSKPVAYTPAAFD